MRRVMILGISGAGKSTLCRALGTKLGIPFYHLDNIYHLPGWVARPEPEVEADFNKLAATESWVVDGMYRGISGALQERADVIVFLDFGRIFAIQQVFKRFALHRLGIRKRVDLGDGFEEKVSWAFISWIWQWPANNRVKWMKQLAPMQDKVVFLKSRKEIAKWLEQA